MRTLFASILALSLFGCGGEAKAPAQKPQPASGNIPTPEGQASAVFAGGCFWCLESDFEHVEGVTKAVSGYSGGTSLDPTYEQVSSHNSDHLEAVRVFYDPKKLSYKDIVNIFWRSVDPTQDDGQFCDHGDQYRTAIFVANAEERAIAEATKKEVAAILKADIDTRILDASRFYDAEGYHQNYYKENPERYNSYRKGCGRDARVKELWGKSAH